MKKNISRVLVLTLVITTLVSGCGNGTESNTSDTQHVHTEESEHGAESENSSEGTKQENITGEGTGKTQSTESSEGASNEEGNSAADTTPSKNEESSKNNTNTVDRTPSYSESNDTETQEDAGGIVLADRNSDKIVYTYGNDSSTETQKLGQAVISEIITSGMSDFDKAKAIHDYLVMNVDYDYENYCANTIPAESYTALGALKYKYAVCAGYAKAFKFLCELAGLECDYVTGTAGGPHAWNQVKVSGKWYNVDVTWDDPVSTGKAFNDHKYNRYSYFLISDELMYKNHTTNKAKHICSSSLNTKAYEVGAPWATSSYAYVKTEAEVNAVIKKAIDANSTAISMTWDTNWLSRTDMGEMVKGMMREYVSMDCFCLDKYSYLNIPNTTLMSCTFAMELKNGSYEKINKLTTIDDIKALVLELENNDEDMNQKTVPMANSLVDDDNFYQVAVWAWEEHDLSIGFSETSIKINSSTKAIHVHAFKNDYYGSHHADEAYKVKNATEIQSLLEKQHTTSNYFRVIFRYGDELGRLSENKLQQYVESTLAPAWAKEYCYESYEVSCDDFVCVMVIRFNPSRHSSKGMSWETVKAPTCISSGITSLKCCKCGKVTQSHEVEPTGICDTYWVYDNETTRHLECKNCDFRGRDLYAYGEVWGYFDDVAAKDMFAEVNYGRANEYFRKDDDWGNYVGTYYAPQLAWDNELAGQARTYAINATTAWLNGEGSQSYNYMGYITKKADSSYNTAEYAAKEFSTNSRGYIRECYQNEELTKAGTTCFTYDKDGTGLKMETIWVIYYGE